MQFSESWLRQFVDPALSTQELSHVLTMSGLEVEETKTLAPPFKQVVVAQILEATQHPDADRLKVCQVSVGESAEPLQIVCGAPNARAGIKIPCALVGAELPAASAQDKPFLIRVGKLRGVQSYGMLCSGKELGLGDDHAGILELPQDAPLGTDIREYLGLDDTIFTIKLTPNKADCLSVAGIAREVAALTNSSLKVHQPTIHAVSIDRRITVKIEDPNLCGRFAGRVITQVNAKATTPAWIVKRLASAGQRSISALVDISNYVMLEMGQPTHIFDLEKISGDLTVRWAKDGESVRLLNGQDLTIQSKGLPLGVISDQRGIESIAGIMGGDYTAVTLETQDIYVESAFWWPSAIQGRARALNFSTDAAYRFERGVDPSHVVTNLHYVTELILQICGGQLGPVDDQVIHLPQLAQVPLRVARVAKIIGLEITGNQIARVGLVENPEAYNSSSVLTLDKASAVGAIKLSGIGYSSASFPADSRITQTIGVGSTAVGRVISYDQNTGVLKYWQDRSLVGFNTDGTANTNPTYGFNLNRFTSTVGTGGTTTIVGTVNSLTIDTNFTGISTVINNRTYYLGQSFSSGVSNPEVKKYSGNIIYVDNRPSITRSSNQKEDIKVILQF